MRLPLLLHRASPDTRRLRRFCVHPVPLQQNHRPPIRGRHPRTPDQIRPLPAVESVLHPRVLRNALLYINRGSRMHRQCDPCLRRPDTLRPCIARRLLLRRLAARLRRAVPASPAPPAPGPPKVAAESSPRADPRRGRTDRAHPQSA